MKFPILTIVLTAVALSAAPARPATPPELESLFPERAQISVEGDGLARLALPAEVLAACRSDLSDLRIVAAGREVPYLIDSGLPPETRVQAETRFEPEVVDVQRRTTERESAPNLLTESYSLAIPEAARGGEAWDLIITAVPRRYVREASVVAIGADGEEETLVERESVFNLPDPGLRKDRIALASLSAETLEVSLTGEEERFLEPTFALETSRTLAEGDPATVALEIVERHPPRDGRSQIEVARPRGLVPDVIRIATLTPSFSRRVEVWDDGPGADPDPLGVGTLFRIETAAGVESFELRVRPARGDRLRVVVDDGDSPPLEELLIVGIVRRPALLFSLPASTGEATLLFGGARAYRPRYDLSGLLPPLPRRQSGERARITEQLYDPTALASASLGPLEANPAFDSTSALTFAMDPGAKIDPRTFEHRVALSAHRASEGLFRVRVSPEIAARARPDLGDLRVVDADDRQIAYLLEPDAGEAELPIAIGSPETDEGISTYELALPIEPMVVDEVVLDSNKEFFDRAFELVGTPADENRGEVVAARGRLVRRPGDPRKLRIELRGERLTGLELRVTDSDDAPLSFFDVAVRAPAADLYFASPGGEYALLLGNPEQSAPSYELARVRSVVLAVGSTSVDATGVDANPSFRASSRLGSGTGLQQVLLWVALAIAVVVLAWFTLRLSRAGDG